MKNIISFIALFCTILTFAQNTKFQEIDTIINAKVKVNDPGIMVGIVKDGNIVYEKYRGLSNLQHQIKVNDKTRSNIASTAKQFTALMVLDLMLKNKLNLEDDIRKYLPKLYQNVKDPIKIRHLINHTSGIRDYVELMSLNGLVWWKRFGLDNDDVMELMEKQEDIGFQPGSKHAYSNSNYIILTKVIEKVSGEKFTKYSKAFFESLGMHETSFVERYMGVIPNRANPYSDWGRGEWWETPTVTKTNGEGFLFTTLKDQLMYEQAVQNANQNNNMLLIKSQESIPNSTIQTYGFGLKLKDRLQRTAVHHDGATYGFHSQTLRFPKEKLTVFIMSNNGNIRSDLIADEIASVFLPKIQQEVQYDERLSENITTENPQILGQYRYPDGDILVRIVQNDGKTYWKEGNYYNLEMIPEGKNTFSFRNNPKLKVVFYKDEMVEFYPSGKTMSYKRNDNAPATFTDMESFLGTYYNSELDLSFELKQTKENTLEFTFSNKDKTKDVQVFNRNDLLAGDNYILKPQRDVFERVSAMLLTYSRAKNIRFNKKTQLKYQPKIQTENGAIQVTTIRSKRKNASNILVTENYPNGNEIWYKQFGGNSYDKANSIINTDDGYLIIGSTSSYGAGNYDMFVIKIDKKGNKLWQNTYGDFYNEYGYAAEIKKDGYLLKGTKQDCENNTDIHRKCTTNVWFVSIDKNGKLITDKKLEEL